MKLRVKVFVKKQYLFARDELCHDSGADDNDEARVHVEDDPVGVGVDAADTSGSGFQLGLFGLFPSAPPPLPTSADHEGGHGEKRSAKTHL